MDVRRVYVEKREGFNIEALRLRTTLAEFLGGQYPALAKLRDLRILKRYDAAHLDDDRFRKVTAAVLSEPQCDRVYYGAEVPADGDDRFFAVEYVPGQYDQRSDSAEQCAELVTAAGGAKPLIRSAVVYILVPGELPVTAGALEAVKRYLINPVDSREASLDLPPTLEDEGTEPEEVPVLTGFISEDEAGLKALARTRGLAMSPEDLAFCRAHFASAGRDPTLTELRVLDTYWSDHCRHSTFNTALERIDIADGPSGPALKKALDLYRSARRELYGEAADQGSLSAAAPPDAGASRHPPSLMDMAVIGMKLLRKRGLAADLDESDEINACTVKITAEFADSSGASEGADVRTEPWLLLFKNETHNHPTEIEPFGGAATCLGGAIRDPLSGRAYVHQAMRISGGADPRRPLTETLPGKLPQVKIAREAAAGYSSYGNQIGLATGQVAEFYHPGFLAKRMELGAVIAAVPAAWVRREPPAPGDLVILVGGRTGRDGIGGATGSSKVHTGKSVEQSGAEVQKGNAVEERKLQRLFRNPLVTALVKRCNDFGAGGVAVAVGELAPGLDIELDRVPKKYAGLDGTELAISESQERMAVVVDRGGADAFIRAAAAENLDAVVIAGVTHGGTVDSPDEARLRMFWRDRIIVDLSREFLNTSGAPRAAKALIPAGAAEEEGPETAHRSPQAILDDLERELMSLRSGSRRGLQERFDGSIGAASVLFPWGGGEQGTPECGMAALLPSREGRSLTASLMTFGYDPALMERNPYEGAKGAVREALAKFACLGGDPLSARLSLQEYFARPSEPESWGKPAAALLGALEAQIALGVPAIGGKDSMSGNYRDEARGIDLEVPPTLAAFAAGTVPARCVRSGALRGEAGNVVILLAQTPPAAPAEKDEWEIFRANMETLAALTAAGAVRSAYPVGPGGAAAALALMAFGNGAGVRAESAAFRAAGHRRYQGSVLVELDGETFAESVKIVTALAGSWTVAARTIGEPVFRLVSEAAGENGGDAAGDGAEIPLAVLRRAYEYPLAQVYPQTAAGLTVAEAPEAAVPDLPPLAIDNRDRRSHPHASRGHAAPLAVLPVFPGTNCEWDMEKAFREAGARTRLVVFRNRSREDIAASIAELTEAIGEAQIVALSGGFSAGDEPDGSGKFIANVLRAPAVAGALTALLEKRDGLVIGICNGFQALIKTGLVPYGGYRDAGETMPTLSFNRIGRHVSRMVRTRVMPNRSPWLALDPPGTIYILPVSHGEGRLVIGGEEGKRLFESGQVPFCYVDGQGRPTMAEPDNPNGSDFAIESIVSPDGRVLGKMGHSERCGEYVHINIPGNKTQRLFEAGVRYFL
ncbi:MAG: phosphoribosylformylglycinamidine synthase [Treponema sp.]|jgi:phosphoribosylformylglycinamidine synthase|nr:phosphoribosylformylglycinamidine synthase [Treponema sp.]